MSTHTPIHTGVEAEQLTPIRAFGHYQRRRNLSPETIGKRRHRLIQLAAWLAPNSLLDATTEQIEGWLDSRDISPQTRYGYVGMISAFYRWAHRERLVDVDPAEALVRPRLPTMVPRPISDDDLARAVDQADPRMRCWLLLAAFAGCRVAEIADLRVEDLHRDRHVILIHGKGNKERLVPLHPDVLDALIRFGLPRSGHIFRRVDGRPMRPGTISSYVSRYFRSIGVESTAHKGRHSFATWVYWLSGGDLRMTQELLGHSSPVTTAGYAAWRPAEAIEVVTRLSLHQEDP